MPNLKHEVVDKHVARIAASVFKAVEERHELLPYMKKWLIKDIVHNMETLTDSEIISYVEAAKARNLFNATTKEEGPIREH